MPRQPALVREAGPDDAARLLELWRSAASGEALVRAVEEGQQAIAQIAADPDERLLVLETEGRVVAAMMIQRRRPSPLSLESVVHTSFLVVDHGHRRHGYAHALMEAAVAWAEEKDVAEVTALVDTDRETNRFFARLGLSTRGTLRYVPTGVLRKRLAHDVARVPGRAHGRSNRHLADVLAQRRTMRRRLDAS